jgi:hypothetical protein
MLWFLYKIDLLYDSSPQTNVYTYRASLPGSRDTNTTYIIQGFQPTRDTTTPLPISQIVNGTNTVVLSITDVCGILADPTTVEFQIDYYTVTR